ncbi:malonyl-CoA decarboxylase, mitochondrial-like isoform X2 [Dysidea avara]|uniref:malonyl-CoA decarboxylase, mitochondrial-like isoform X2 n=1 Tax=Dysidea avara TaxID=196820 RepID=UPI00331A49A6
MNFTLRRVPLLYMYRRCFSGEHNVRGAHAFWEEFLSRLSQGAAAVRSGERSVSHTRNQLEAAVRAKRSIEAIELIPEGLASDICDYYLKCRDNEQSRLALLTVVARDLGVDHDRVREQVQRHITLHNEGRGIPAIVKSEDRMRHALSPLYMQLFNLIGQLEGGVKFLVDLRADLIDVIKKRISNGHQHDLEELDKSLKQCLSQWFSGGFLELEQLTWQSSCDIMEKISDYEAVHPLRHWRDLKHRVSSRRRCFIFTHRALPREPLIILHTALTSQPSSNIQELLDYKKDEDHPQDVSTAVFYSISATQKGLAGIELGNFIIKRVVNQLLTEFPSLNTFVTLSPIPGYRKWLTSYLHQHKGAPLSSDDTETPQLNITLLEQCSWSRDDPSTQQLATPLSKLCARYLAVEKRRGFALDPVAHFHLHNGASLWRINWLADSSQLGMSRSYGMMVNYKYHLPDIASNANNYIVNGQVPVSSSVQKLLQ